MPFRNKTCLLFIHAKKKLTTKFQKGMMPPLVVINCQTASNLNLSFCKDVCIVSFLGEVQEKLSNSK